MDVNKVVSALRDTIDPTKQSEAEKTLMEMTKIVSFTPLLLSIVDNASVEMPVRQAGVIYLKNIITKYWAELGTANSAASSSSCSSRTPSAIESLHFTILEQDKHRLRETIVDVIVRAPDILRVQLGVCVGYILKSDFPTKWPNVVEGIIRYLSCDGTVVANVSHGEQWSGALLVLYRLVKNYEYKKQEERVPLTEAMRMILPILYERLEQLLPDASAGSVSIQKSIVKIFFALIQFSFSLDLMSQEVFGKWMEVMRVIVARPVPPETLEVDEEERPELIWWKCKKWAMHLLHRIFERYGNPGTSASDYAQFAEFYLKHFSGPVIETVLQMLSDVRNRQYVSPRVLHEALMYLSEGTGHSFSWKFMKAHMMAIIQEVLYPLMCHSQRDKDLWTEDPQEFIRVKYDVFEEIMNPVHATINLITNVMKRKDMLDKTVQFVVQLLNDPNLAPEQKDGALHIVGILAPKLIRRKMYKKELEAMLVSHVFPLAQSPFGFLRARACWCIREFSEINFKDESNLVQALRVCVALLLTDAELPVQMEAAMALHLLVADQEKVSKMLEPEVQPVIIRLLELIASTQNDDLCTVMQKFIEDYMQHVIPIAVDIARRLAQIFIEMIQASGDPDTRDLTAMGILGTLESIVDVMEDHAEILAHLEEIVRSVVLVVIDNSVMDFYEEVLSLVYSLTCKKISEPMWQVFGSLCKMYEEDGGIEYFVDMMPALHNYLTVDTDAFLSNPARIKGVLSMCKNVLSEDPGDEAECHAAKLLEVIILQCKGKIDEYLHDIVQLVLARLTREIKTSELRTMCLLVLIAALQYNPQIFLHILQSLQPPDSSMSIVDHFISQWLSDTDCFLGLHDRRMCILGLLTLLNLQPRLPALVNPEMAKQILPSCILLFDGLQRAYEAKALKEKKDVGGSDDDDDDDDSISDGIDGGDIDLADDEDELNDEDKAYIEMITQGVDKDSGNGNDDHYLDADLLEETDLEVYDTPIDRKEDATDEFIIFKQTMQALQVNEQDWCSILSSSLSDQQQEKLRKVFQVADQRKALADSKNIEKGGGYNFGTQNVPSSFNFGGGSAFA